MSTIGFCVLCIDARQFMSIGALAGLLGAADQYRDLKDSVSLGTASFDKDGSVAQGGMSDLFISLASGELFQDAGSSAAKMGSFGHMMLLQFAAKAVPGLSIVFGIKEAAEGVAEFFRGQAGSGFFKLFSAGMMIIPGGAVAAHLGKMFKINKKARALNGLNVLKEAEAKAIATAAEAGADAAKIAKATADAAKASANFEKGLVKYVIDNQRKFLEANKINASVSNLSELQALAEATPKAQLLLNNYNKWLAVFKDKDKLGKMISAVSSRQDRSMHQLAHILGSNVKITKDRVSPYINSFWNGAKGRKLALDATGSYNARRANELMNLVS